MRILIAAAAVLFMVQEDPASKVRELVDRMQEEDIVVSDGAATDLVKLGRTAIPALKDLAGRSEGDLKGRIEAVVRKIERTEKLAKAFGTVPTVTVHSKDRPVSEILAELEKQSGLKIQGKDLASDAVASLDVDKASIWKAVDDLCRGHGKLMYSFSPKRIQVLASPFRDLPRVHEGNGFFFINSMTLGTSFQGDAIHSNFSIQGGLAWPSSAQAFLGSLQFDVLEDDKGTNLLASAGAGGFAVAMGGELSPKKVEDAFLYPLSFYPPEKPAEDATCIARCRGKVVLKFAVEMKRIVSLKAPLDQPTGSADEGRNNIKVTKWTREGRTVRFGVTVATHRPRTEGWNSAGEQVVLHDTKGNLISGDVSDSGSSGRGDNNGITITRTCSAVFTLPEGAEVASIDVVKPAETEELLIPFDFKNLPLK